MIPPDIAAFHAGIRHAVSMAQLAALTLELRPDANHVRQRAAIEALRGLAEGLKASLLDTQVEAPGKASLQSDGPA